MITLNEHFTYKKIFRFTIPSVIMMIFTSIYVAVDGLFIANFTGKTAFAAVNFIWPFLFILSGVGFMFGSGGSALIAKRLGEKDEKSANEIFTALIIVSLIMGILLALIGYLILEPVAIFLGAKDEMLKDCLKYGNIYLIGIPLSIVQGEFQNLFVTAKKPHLGLWSTIISGVMNIILDAIFVAGFKMGIEGASIATVISMSVGGIIPLIYFLKPHKDSLLHFTKCKVHLKDMFKICSNGLSELLNNISSSIVGMVYNAQLLKYAGDNGIASYGILMYINFIFISIFIGYSIGISPVVSFHYGSENHKELKSLLKKSFSIIGVVSFIMFISSELLGKPISNLFVGYDDELNEMTRRGFLLYSFCFLFAGFGIFSSAFFTALNNGVISAIISVMRTVVFEIAFVYLLPLFWKIDGVWLSVVFAEFLASVLGFILILSKKKQYKYL